jgi:hypothetical protein
MYVQYLYVQYLHTVIKTASRTAVAGAFCIWPPFDPYAEAGCVCIVLLVALLLLDRMSTMKMEE